MALLALLTLYLDPLGMASRKDTGGEMGGACSNDCGRVRQNLEPLHLKGRYNTRGII